MQRLLSGWKATYAILMAGCLLWTAGAEDLPHVLGALGEPSWEIVRDDSGFHFSLQVPGIALKPGPDGCVVEMEGHSYRASSQPPIPPRIAKVVRVPADVACQVEWTPPVYEVVTNMLLAGASVEGSEWLPEPVVSLTQAWMGTQQLIRIECCPVQYNATARAIRFARQMHGEIRFK